VCGITGICSKSSFDRSIIEQMTQEVRLRGPDAHGIYHNEGATTAVGHTRLSVIDLHARANQPMFSKNKRYVIVYNGEIYNYQKVGQQLQRETGIQFTTTSDTEVLVEAFAHWGHDFVQKLNGMFAFAIYDIQLNILHLYRDRVGKKPLFYFLSKNLFAFASEIKALLKHPEIRSSLTVKKPTISSFLQLGYIPQPDTFYEHIFKFPAGHYGTVTQGIKFSTVPYWNVLDQVKPSRYITESNALKGLKDRLDDAVTSRLVADVPLGIFLSGGIDSSLVTAIASKSAKLNTYSIGFKENKFDESVYAERIAKYLGTDHHRYILTEQDGVGLMEQYLDHFDEPFADTSAIPTMLVSQHARKEVTVALTGDGGDELFLGYGSYTWANRLASPLWSSVRPVVKMMTEHLPSHRWKRASRLFEKVPSENVRQHIFSQEQYLFSDSEVRDQVLKSTDDYTGWYYSDLQALSNLSPAELQALFDFQYYLRDDLLVKVDRASMFYGLECRCPLLDYNLVEFAVNLPESLKKRSGVTKYLLKEVLFELIPETYFDRPKWGFSIPLAQWMKNDLSYMMEYISEERLEKTQTFNPVYIRNLVDRFSKGEGYIYNRLWAVIIAQRFLLQHV
jgi:asparagine synthase (glutamine-hydrolysing)